MVGFLIGEEVAWLPETLRIIREEARDLEVMVLSQSSPELASGLMRSKIDVAFLRREKTTAGLEFKLLGPEPLRVLLPAAHRLAKRKSIDPLELEREIYISPARMAPVLQSVIDDYAKRICIALNPQYDAENLSAVMSLVASTGGFSLFPHYVQHMLTRSVVARPLQGLQPTIDLMMGYNKSNGSAVLARLLARLDELVKRVQASSNLRSRN